MATAPLATSSGPILFATNVVPNWIAFPTLLNASHNIGRIAFDIVFVAIVRTASSATASSTFCCCAGTFCCCPSLGKF